MPEENAPGRSKRPCLIFRAGGSRFALPATAVREVADVAAGPGATHGGLPVESLAELLALPADGEGGVTLVLDASPPRALHVAGVDEVADFSIAEHLNLPTGAESPAAPLFRGAVLHDGRLVLELLPEPLARFEALASVPPEVTPPVVEVAEPVDERALIFVVGEEELLALPLSVVTRILGAPQLCPLPYARPGLAGILEHERSLLPVFDPAVMLGRGRTSGEYVIAADVGSGSIGLLARHVRGVVPELRGPPEPVPGGTKLAATDGAEVLVPDLRRWVESGSAPSAQARDSTRISGVMGRS